MKLPLVLLVVVMLLPLASAFQGGSANYNVTISNINYGTGDAESNNYRISFSLIDQPTEQSTSENYGIALGFYNAVAAAIQRLLSEPEWWFVAVMTSFNGSIFMLFLLSKRSNNIFMTIPLHIAQILLIIITITFAFTALDLFENTELISGIMQTFFAVIIKGLLLPTYILMIIYLLYSSVQKMQQKDLNKF